MDFYSTDIDFDDNNIIIETKNEYICLDKKTLLPKSTFISRDSKNYIYEIAITK